MGILDPACLIAFALLREYVLWLASVYTTSDYACLPKRGEGALLGVMGCLLFFCLGLLRTRFNCDGDCRAFSENSQVFASKDRTHAPDTVWQVGRRVGGVMTRTLQEGYRY